MGQYIHIWAWLILTNDYKTTSENGHWMCYTKSNMFICGELKENLKLVLCFIPRPIPAMLSCLFGRQTYLKSCNSWFYVILSICLFPLLAIVALIALGLLLILMLIFLP